MQAQPGAASGVARQLCQQDQESHPDNRVQRDRNPVLARPRQVTGDELLGDHLAELYVGVPPHPRARQFRVPPLRPFQVIEGSLGDQLRDRRYECLGHLLVHERLRLEDPQEPPLPQGAGENRVSCRRPPRHVPGKEDGDAVEEQQQVLQAVRLLASPVGLRIVVGQVGERLAHGRTA